MEASAVNVLTDGLCSQNCRIHLRSLWAKFHSEAEESTLDTVEGENVESYLFEKVWIQIDLPFVIF